jgi:hypothetical protein
MPQNLIVVVASDRFNSYRGQTQIKRGTRGVFNVVMKRMKMGVMGIININKPTSRVE